MIVTIDTGGTKTLISGFGRNGRPGKMIRFPTPAHTSEYVALLKETLRAHYADKPVEAIVIALPGIIDHGVAVWCKNLGWSNFDAKKALEGVLGDVPIFVDNDANLAGLAETRAIRPTPVSSLYVTISTGIGSGFITNGKIDPGLSRSEAGHALIEYDGIVREWQSFASGRAIHDAYGKFAREITSKRAWNQIADRISRGFLAVIPIAQPDVIIIGGSIGTYFTQYEERLKEILQEKLPPHIPCPTLIQASHPEEAVIYGCYYYALDQLDSR
jgi:predicted NBD/HSP70 family sugar kinase